MKYLFHEVTAYCSFRKTLLIMRLTIILLVAWIFQVSARGIAQTVTLSVNNMPIEKVCKEIEKQTGFYFVYAKDMAKSEHTISLNMDHVAINDALHQIFINLPFTYQIIDKVVVINTIKKIAPITSIPPDRMIRVEGVVLSDQERPLSESSVTIKSTGRGTFTNEKGEFVLPAVPENGELIISHVGFGAKTVVAKEGKLLEVRMAPSANVLDAQVVKGYYFTSKRLDPGNSVTVKGEDIAIQPVSDPILALEGRVAGLSIAQTSGVPGASSVVRLRGQNTIADGKPLTANDPLFIVDGIPFSSQSLTSEFVGGGVFKAPNTYENHTVDQGMSPFNTLNPSDIESIEVLKDADATAIYGSRGANGVILITTKKGRIGRNNLDINIYSGVSQVARKMKLLNTEQYLQMQREGIRNDGYEPYLTTANAAYFADILIWDTTRYTDWQKILIGNVNHFTNAQVNLSGGTPNTQFIIGGGYSRQGTLFPGDYQDQKASLHVGITQASKNQKLHTQLSINYVNDNSNMPNQDLTNYITLAPDAPAIYNKNGSPNWETYGGTDTWANPLAYTVARSKSISEFSSGNLFFDYKVLRGLALKCNLGYSHQQMNQTNLLPSTYYSPPSDNDPNYRSSSFAITNSRSWIIEPQINYSESSPKNCSDVN